MKQLFWKEWRELRFLPLGAAGLCLILQFGYCMMCLLRIGGNGAEDFTLSYVRGIAWGLWMFFATLAGSGLMSQEIGTGTLTFLFALPTSRRQIWLVKVASGAASLLLCIVLSAIVAMIAGLAARPDLLQGMNSPSTILFSSESADAILCAFGCFAVSIAVSPLLDRYISAAAVSIGTCLIITIVIAMGTTGYDMPYSPDGVVLQYRMDYAIVWLCIPLFIAISYWTFTHGETLRSAKRFYAAGRAVVVSLVAFVALFLFARSYVLAQSAFLVRPEVFPSPNVTSAGWQTQLSIARETDSQAHELYIVQFPDPSASYRLRMDWKVDGGRLSGSSAPYVSSVGVVHIGAWIDSDEDMLVKSVLNAQGITAPHPGTVTFGLHMEGNGASFTPLTLYFKHGADWSSNSNGLTIDPSRPYRLGQKLTILDAIFSANAGKGKALNLQDVPNDSSSEALFKSGAAHRVTVTAVFERVK